MASTHIYLNYRAVGPALRGKTLHALTKQCLFCFHDHPEYLWVEETTVRTAWHTGTPVRPRRPWKGGSRPGVPKFLRVCKHCAHTRPLSAIASRDAFLELFNPSR